MTAFTARALSTNRLQEQVNQTTHGFVIGDIVNYDGGVPPWVLAKADNILDCQGSCMVSFVIDADNFVVTQVGHVVNITDPSISPLNVGVQYYLSPTLAGAMTITKPTTVGQFVLPCFVADTTTSGYFFGGTGVEIEPATTFAWNVETTTPINMMANQGYIANRAGTPIVFNLPANFNVGDVIEILGINTGGWIIQCGAGQSILIGQQGATSLSGTLASTNGQDSVDLIGVVQDDTFTANNIEGNLSFT